jgi:rhodanese-related sulfurtransferase
MRRVSVSLFVAALALVSILSLYAAPKESKLPPKLGDKELAALIKAEGPRLLILDVRTAEEFESGHLPAALLLPYDEIAAKFEEVDKSRPIVVYCRSGRRSAIAKSTLEGMGYANVSDFGAVASWSGPLIRGK